MPNLSLKDNNLRLYNKTNNFGELVLIKNSNLRRVLRNWHLELVNRLIDENLFVHYSLQLYIHLIGPSM